MSETGFRKIFQITPSDANVDCKHFISIFVLFLAIPSLLISCVPDNEPLLSPTETVAVIDATETVAAPDITPEHVTFLVPIEVANFSDEATLHVRLFNAEQLDQLEKFPGGCVVEYDAQTQQEVQHCPEGYQEVIPEEFDFPLPETDGVIEINSLVVRVEERYSLSISGLSRDDCNPASAIVESVADSAEVNVGNLAWSTTLMACE